MWLARAGDGHVRAAALARNDSLQAKLDKLDAMLAQSSTSAQDAALLAEIAGENRLRDIFGQAEIEPVGASAGRELYRSEQSAARVDLDGSLFAACLEELSGES